MTSLKHLAEALDLSITQVSRALDDKPDVSAKTKVRVREMAQKMGYFPNAAARSLRKQKADAVAVVLPAGANHVGLGSLLNTLYDTAGHLATLGYDLIMVPGLQPGDELETLKRIVDGRRADAIILVRTRRQDERVAFLTERGIPFVTHGRTDGHIVHPYVDGDGEAGFADATRMLAGLGHSRIAHISAPLEMSFSFHRRAGWLAAMKEIGADKGLLERGGPPTEQGGYLAARALLAERSQPTALLCATDAMAIGAYSAVREAGLVPGETIAIVGHDNLPACTLMTPHLSTMAIAVADFGKQLADKLHRRLGGADPRDLQDVFPVRQIPRASHGPNRIKS
jgi:LacI family transcriptional regulator